MRQLQDNRTGQLALPVPQLAGLVGVPASLPLHLIDAEDQVRTTSGIDESLDELADSIKSRGVLQPILVRPQSDGGGLTGRYVLIAGHRRTLAANIAGLENIPAMITEADVDQALEMQIAENIQREQLNLSELATAVRRLFDKHGNLAKVGEIVKKSPSWVSKHLALSYPEFSHTAKYLLTVGFTNDLELLHTVNQIEKTGTVWNKLSQLVDNIKSGKAGRKEARELLAEAKDKKAAAKATQKALDAPTQKPVEPSPRNPAEDLVSLSYEVIDADGEIDVAELLAKISDETHAAIADALKEHWLARSHAKGTKHADAAPAVKLRALATHEGSHIDKAAFILGTVGAALTPYNLLVEVREICRLADDE
jgi:ParB/RepB/Spo0J family partition protein